MRLFLYYALHSFKNQIKKLFRTWVIVFILACGVMGGLIGFIAGSLSEEAEETQVQEEEEETPSLPFSDPEQVLEESGLSLLQIMELICGGVVLLVLLIEIYGADTSGSKIFLPADVSLLFPSPLKPQSVLLFRLVARLGLAFMATLYFMFEIPALLHRLHLPFWIVLLFIITWFLTLIVSKLLQMLLYTLSSTRPSLKSLVRRCVYALVLLLLAGFIVFQRVSGLSYLPAAARFFNAPFTRWIPVWGWLKGICLFAVEKNLVGLFLCLVLVAAAIAGLIYLIWHVKADFYEEALQRTEETAAILQEAQERQESGGSVLRRRKKDRSESLVRDGLHRGWGASIFFYKTMYNRFRFAHLRVFTKTSETYLVAAVGMALVSRFVLHTREITLVGLVLAGLSFYRALGNPLSQDTEMPYFRLIPEPAWKKLLYSLLGGTANCLLDTIMAVIPAVILLKADPLTALGWVLFTASVDFYATSVGTFIDLSVPGSAGRMIKQLIQIFFIYFGLIPDAAILFFGHRSGAFLSASILAVLVNLVIGCIFLSITPVFLEPKERLPIVEAALTEEQRHTARRHFSRLGLGPFLILVIASVLQIGLMLWLQAAKPSWASQEWVTWVFNFAPIYLVAIPLGCLAMRKVPVEPLSKESWPIGRVLMLFPICVFLMYCGSLIGTFINWLFSLLIPSASGANPLNSLVQMDSVVWRILVMVVAAPVFEEFVFRKQLIDRMHVYGEKRAIVLSALMFGLFHGNFSQMFYAFLLGLVFGWVYLKTGRLRYSIGLHMVINFMGSVIAPELLKSVDLEMVDQLSMSSAGGIVIYLLILLFLFILGLILLVIRSRHVRFVSAPLQLPHKGAFRISCLNPGMILFFLGCLVLVVSSLL